MEVNYLPTFKTFELLTSCWRSDRFVLGAAGSPSSRAHERPASLSIHVEAFPVLVETFTRIAERTEMPG